MLMYLIALLLVIIAFNTFAITYQANGINRVVVSTPISLLESYVELYGDNSLLINVPLGEDAISEYYWNNISKYTPNFDIEFYPYNVSDGSYCVYDYCSGLEINIKANLSFGFKYNKSFYYEVKHNYE